MALGVKSTNPSPPYSLMSQTTKQTRGCESFTEKPSVAGSLHVRTVGNAVTISTMREKGRASKRLSHLVTLGSERQG